MLEKIRELVSLDNQIWNGLACRVEFNKENFNFLSAYIPAKRFLDMEVPKSIEKIDIEVNRDIDNDLSRDFLKYIIYLDYQRLRAKTDEDKQRLQSM